MNIRAIGLVLILFAVVLTGCSTSVTKDEIQAADDTNRWRTEQVARKAHTAEVFAVACSGAFPTIERVLDESGAVIGEVETYTGSQQQDCSKAPPDQYAMCVMAAMMAADSIGDCVADIASDAKDASNVGVITASSRGADMVEALVGGAVAIGREYVPIGLMREMRKSNESDNQVIANALDNAGGNQTYNGSFNQQTDASRGDVVSIGRDYVGGDRGGDVVVDRNSQIGQGDRNQGNSGRINSVGDDCDGNECQPINTRNPIVNNEPDPQPAPVPMPGDDDGVCFNFSVVADPDCVILDPPQ